MSSKRNSCVKDSTESHPFGVDDILAEIGQFGTFQRLIFLVVLFLVVFNTIISVGFIITAGTVTYRCRVPECDESKGLYDSPWSEFSIPKTGSGKLEKCKRYTAFNSSNVKNICTAENFDQEVETECDNDFIFRDNEVTISNDFKIFCSDEWKLAMIGTFNNLGQFIGIPLGGYLSDRFGRRIILTCGGFMSALVGTVRSFSPNYYIFAVLGFVDNLFGATLYPTAFVLALEIVGPKIRVIGCTFVCMCNSLGGLLLATTAINLPNWRWIERIFYIPGLLFITLPWVIPESFRWLLSQGDEENVVKTLKKTARINKRKLSDSSIEKLLEANRQNLAVVKSKDTSKKFPIGDAFKVFPWRIINCCFCWFTNVMVFFGMNLNLDLLGGNKYTSFIFVVLVEIPGVLLPSYTMNRYGRRNSLFAFMLLGGVSILAMAYIDSEFAKLQLILYLIGKMFASASFQTLYFLTSEIFPTSVRNSLLSFCSMVGRFGSMVAPQTPLMAKFYAPAPAILFASFAILSGSLALFFPETKDSVLPTTLADAEKIGQKETNAEPETEDKLLESKV